MAETAWLRVKDGAVQLDIKAQPGASKTEVAGLKDGRLKIRIAAAPEDGKANDELRRFLAAVLRCPRGKVTVLRGEKSRLKTLSVPLAFREKAEALGENRKIP
ncbi:MAG: DUF167 domain-containing protein [Treponema sp.]|jgi:uncharacterized protein (TIGR00251 family)|nr:DUF167 domain-containing protein [Treponema sp.]